MKLKKLLRLTNNYNFIVVKNNLGEDIAKGKVFQFVDEYPTNDYVYGILECKVLKITYDPEAKETIIIVK